MKEESPFDFYRHGIRRFWPMANLEKTHPVHTLSQVPSISDAQRDQFPPSEQHNPQGSQSSQPSHNQPRSPQNRRLRTGSIPQDSQQTPNPGRGHFSLPSSGAHFGWQKLQRKDRHLVHRMHLRRVPDQKTPIQRTRRSKPDISDVPTFGRASVYLAWNRAAETLERTETLK